MTDLLTIISQRDGLAKAIDAEFDGLPAQEAGTRTYYCYRRGCMVTGTAYNLGAKRTPAPLPMQFEDKSKPAHKPYTVPAPKRDLVVDYIYNHGPVTCRQISEGTGVSTKTVKNTVNDLTVTLPIRKARKYGGRGITYTYEWIGEE